MRSVKCFLAAVVFVTSGMSAQAAVFINFDAITTGASVDSFYNGGTDSLGEVGPSLGVGFQTRDWLTTTGFGETTQPNLAYSSSGLGSIDVYGGFTSLNFTYGAFSAATLSIYSGLDGTGSLLGSAILPANDPNAFSPGSVSFGGTGFSIVLSAGAGQFGLDDMYIGTGTTPVPEPASLTLVVLGAVSMTFGAYRLRRQTA